MGSNHPREGGGVTLTPERLAEIRAARPVLGTIRKRTIAVGIEADEPVLFGTAEEVLALVSAAERERWVPVGEGMPEEGSRVWVSAGGYAFEAEWTGTRWIDADEGFPINGRPPFVTHWRPLPEGPK